MPASSVPPLLAALLCAATLSAQSTWIVDRTNGPGTHFTDLPAAVAQAAPGDILRIRYHDPLQVAPYTAPTIGKALTLLGAGGRPGLQGTLLVQGLPAGQHVTLRELQLAPFVGAVPGTSNCHLRLLGNQGTVHLQYVTRTTTPQSASANNNLTIANSRLVEFDFCSFEMVGLNGTFQISDTARVTATSSAFQGVLATAQPLLRVSNSELVLADTLVLAPPLATGALAIDACNATVRLAGSATSVMAPAGTTAIGSTCGGTVVVGSGAFVGPVSGVTLVAQPVPALGGVITNAQLLRIGMFGESLGIGLIAVGDPLPTTVPLFGDGLWLDPGAAGILQVVPFDLTGRGSWQMTLTTPLPTGTNAWLQGVSLGLTSGFLLTPSVVVTGP